ncbi:MAG TPA: hypothetical protein VHO71_05375 [Caproiciproducens sp.]|nr:hypothetical protein [Caproiciproducens sp.]
MESFTINGVPTDWNTTTPGAVSEQTALGRVHSGNSSVNLTNGAVLSQVIPDINPGCFYELSFFVNAQGGNVGFTATVYFVTPAGLVTGASVTVRQGDLENASNTFAYFEVFTDRVPDDATAAIVQFNVVAEGGQSINLDDVSFSSR